MKAMRIACGLAIAATTLATELAIAQTRYRVVEMPVQGVEGPIPIAITSNGKLLVTGGPRVLVCSESKCRRLPYGSWIGLNDMGALAGYGVKPNGSGVWAVRKDPQQGGGKEYLTHGQAMAIAPDGAVVGYTGARRAFLYTDHRIDLDGLASLYPLPMAININHVIVGSSQASDDQNHATMWVDGGAPQDLGLAPGHIASGARAVNVAGIAVGYSYHPTRWHQPARFADGSVQVFQLPHVTDWGLATGVNASGTVVGYFATVGGYRAGVVEGDRMVDLNTRLLPQYAGRYRLWQATAINDAGQIAAAVVDSQGENARAVRLDPIDPLSTTGAGEQAGAAEHRP